jgi:hypothetical protein
MTETAPTIRTVTHTVNTPSGPRQVEVPDGIDPGFDYNPGEAAFGHKLNDQVMEQWRREGRKYERLSTGGWAEAGRPQKVPSDRPVAKLGPPATTASQLAEQTRQAIGGAERVFILPDGARVLVDAAALANHLRKDLGRAVFLPFLPEVLEAPFEIWLSFERHPATGKVELRRRLVKVLDLGGKARPMVVTAQVVRGRLETYTYHPVRPNQIGKERVGKLLYGRKVEK